MDLFLGILLGIFVLTVVVTAHEFGHFIIAKSGGIRVNEFFIGMGPTIWKKQKGETLYSIKLLPQSRKIRNAIYWLNPFEMEAYDHQDDLHYLEKNDATEWRQYARMKPSERMEIAKQKRMYL